MILSYLVTSIILQNLVLIFFKIWNINMIIKIIKSRSPI